MQINTWFKRVRLLLVFLIPLILGLVVFRYSLLDLHQLGLALNRQMEQLFQFLVVCDLGYLLFLLVCDQLTYRETPPAADHELPVCTVIVPAYNEGQHVFRTLQSVLASDYPAEKLEIVAVNDGSIDDTWSWICKAAEQSGGRIQTINQPRNMGKKAALYAGIHASEGAVIVTIDSDTLIRPRTLRRLVSPFLRDSRVGSVAGNIRVLNDRNRIIPRMLDANFTFNFDFVRAGQGSCRAVLCTPGALSAYRRSVLEPELDAWLNQTFMGRPASIGEDRALANIVLRQGYGVVFQRSAVAYTNVPEKYKGLCRMMLRWARSDVRENLVMAGYVFRRFSLFDRRQLCLQVTWALSSIWAVMAALSVGLMVYCTVSSHGMFLVMALPLVMLRASVQAVVNLFYRNDRSALYAYVFNVFSFLSLFWIPAYALLTIRNSNWLTRRTACAAGKE